MSDKWYLWCATLGYLSHDGEHKEIARIEFRAKNALAAESYARRHAESLFNVNWGSWYQVIGPIPEPA